MTLTRCMSPADHDERFYDKKLGQCPECGCPVGELNTHLYRAKLDSHLWAQAASARDTQRKYAAIQRGYEVPPDKHQRKLAREIVRDLM